MKIPSFLAATALCYATATHAQAATKTSSSPTTAATSATPSCTATEIAKICDYPQPGSNFAVAGTRNSCRAYCSAHQPCDFVIFVLGNPFTDAGTCWLYPGESYDPKAGTECSNPWLFVDSKPTCAGSSSSSKPTASGTTTSATTTASSPSACAATASPSAVASICGYPEPETCFSTCVASTGASHCLSACAEAESCSYAVFNPRNEDLSPYAAGTCWIYPNGTYDAGAATKCQGKPEQYVYENVCPKSKASSSSSASGSPTASMETVNNAANVAPGVNKNSAPASFVSSGCLAVGMALLVWHGLR